MAKQAMKITRTPLTQCRPGTRVRVCEIGGDKGLKGRLCALGLIPGTPVDILSAGQGPILIKVLGSRLVIGHKMAEKVLVREA